MRVTASQLRADVYRILDRAIEAGEVVEIDRRGVIVRLVPPSPRSWVETLPRRDGVITGDPGDLAAIDWSTSWRPDPL